MRRHEITDESWDRIKTLLPGQDGHVGVTAKDNRLFFNAVLWIAKTGAPWRDLPERFGPWNSVWRRFDRWSKKGVWRDIFETLQDPDLEWMILDSTVVRAHQHAAGAEKKNEPVDEALGRSRGGFSTKIHISVDALGNPIGFLLTGGEVADVTQAEPLIEAHQADAYIADKAYDSNKVVDAAQRRGGIAVIPSKKNRKEPRDYDKHIYKERMKIECFISLLKQNRRVATRYEKTAVNFISFVYLASAMILMR